MLEETLIKWRDQIVRETRREALQEGQRAGRLEGTLEDRRNVLRELLTAKFGRLPQPVRDRLAGITSYRELQRLTRKVLTAKSLADMGLG